MKRERGFTLVEVAVIVPILMLIALGLFQVLIVMVGSADEERTAMNLSYEKESAMNRIEDDARLTTSFRPALDNGLYDPYESYSSSSSWSYQGDGTIRTLILRNYATTTNPLSNDREPVFIGDAATSDCNAATNDALTYDIIYFVSNNNTLYRRTVPNTSVSTCTAQYQKLSCPSITTLAASHINSRDASCGADDEIIATNVTGFSIDYYTDGSTSDPLKAYRTGSALLITAKSIDVSLTQTRTSSGKPVISNNELRIARFN